MTPLRAGVIGLGMGLQHVHAYHRHPHCEVVALCDHQPEKLAAASEACPRATHHRDAAQLLSDERVDVVSIASYDHDHYHQVCSAIRSGKHVMVEKPLCLNAEQVEDIRGLLEDHPAVRLSSNLVLRTSSRFSALRDRIRSGELGRLSYVEGDYNYGRIEKLRSGWRGQIPDYSVTCGGGVHLVDLILWLTGDAVVEVCAYGNKSATPDIPFSGPDLVAALLKFRSGLIGRITSNFSCVMPHFHGLTVYGDGGTFVNRSDAALLYTSRDPLLPPQRLHSAYPGVDQQAVVRDWIDALVADQDPPITAGEVLDTMSVCCAIDESCRTSEPMAVLNSRRVPEHA